VIYIDFINDTVINFLKIFINQSKLNVSYKFADPMFGAYIKFSTAIFNLTVIMTIILIIINFITHVFFKSYITISKFIRYLNLVTISLTLSLLIIKFYFSLKLESILGIFINDLKLEFYLYNNSISYLEHFTVFSSAFSDGILMLSYFTGIICLELLGFKNLFKNINNLSVFFIFNIFVTIMVSTNNLLIMFISFEFLFLPTIFFAYKLGYVKKIDKATKVLFL